MIFDSEVLIRFEKMIQSGIKIVRDAIEQYKPIAVFGGFSGGDDSIVACHFATANFGAAVAHCNTLTGLQANRDHVQSVVDRFGWHLIEKFATANGPPKSTRKYIDGKRVDPVSYTHLTLPTKA